MGELDWRRSSRCEAQACVEVAVTPTGAHVRDSKLTASPVLNFGAPAWDAFLNAVKRGDFRP